jgi:hypothetical protein
LYYYKKKSIQADIDYFLAEHASPFISKKLIKIQKTNYNQDSIGMKSLENLTFTDIIKLQ